MAVNTRVRATRESVVGDAEIHHQRHRTRHIHEVTNQLDVPTSFTPVPIHLLFFYFVGCSKEVSKLINHPVVSLFDTRVGGTGANMIAKSINSKLFATTSRERNLHDNWDCCADTSCKKEVFIITDKVKLVGEEVKGVGVMKDKEVKIEEIEVSHTLGR